MKPDRLEKLYKQQLTSPEASLKELPLKHILSKPSVYYPERPVDWNFDILEIGPGTGDFLFAMAEEHVEAKILAIEIGNKRFERIKNRIQKRELTQITLIHADARVPFHLDIPDNSIEKCFVLFPDPWPRNKHSHLRLLQKEFLSVLCKKLKPGGEFTLGTDVKDYATWALGNIKTITGMENTFGKDDMRSELPDIPMTFFAKKWQKMGRSFHFLRFKKVQTHP
jgi:tRNA (guanine-N7-)-methyltransferase